jgi:hypothetical protein
MKMISRKKEAYPIGRNLRAYLNEFGRATHIPLDYTDLLRFSSSIALYDKHDNDTLWSTVSFPSSELREIHDSLLKIYATIRSFGDTKYAEHLKVDRIDLCLYGNSKPFRIRIINTLNENFDYFYVKRADASRIYGLELEHILSPDRISFFIDASTLVEEHIIGIPGDMFIENYGKLDHLNWVRLAKEFVKFNERCRSRLLGDMHAANFVVNIITDFDNTSFRIRPIDFDQQSHEPRLAVYTPHLYQENRFFTDLVTTKLSKASVDQYQREERALISRRCTSSAFRLSALMKVMKTDAIAATAAVNHLRNELANDHQSTEFGSAQSMGELIEMILKRITSEH